MLPAPSLSQPLLSGIVDRRLIHHPSLAIFVIEYSVRTLPPKEEHAFPASATSVLQGAPEDACARKYRLLLTSSAPDSPLALSRETSSLNAPICRNHHATYGRGVNTGEECIDDKGEIFSSLLVSCEEVSCEERLLKRTVSVCKWRGS